MRAPDRVSFGAVGAASAIPRRRARELRGGRAGEGRARRRRRRRSRSPCAAAAALARSLGPLRSVERSGVVRSLKDRKEGGKDCPSGCDVVDRSSALAGGAVVDAKTGGGDRVGHVFYFSLFRRWRLRT